MSYTVKPASTRHIAMLPEIERAATAVFPADDLPSAERIEHVTVPQFEEAQRNDRLWVAADEHDEPVGFLIAEIVDGTWHIAEMDVHPDHARRGLGVTLLRHVLFEAEHVGHTAVTLTTFSHLPWNGPFYSRNGFVEITDSECGPELLERLRQERARGLEHRVAMRRAVRRMGRGRHWADG